MPEQEQITRLLIAWQAGDAQALERLAPFIDAELRRLARRQMRNERPGHTLQPTALVHEAFLRLVGAEVSWQSRAHFLAVAARLMRRILVDHARRRDSARRGGPLRAETLDESLLPAASRPPAIVELDEALDRLAAFDARMAAGIELLFFGGLTPEEGAEALGISRSTLFEDLRLAKAWLKDELG